MGYVWKPNAAAKAEKNRALAAARVPKLPVIPEAAPMDPAMDARLAERYPMLHGYQRRTVQFIRATKKAFVCLDLGLGKTLSTLTAIADMKRDGIDISPVLVIAPKRVAETVWHAEAARWDHTKDLRVVRLLGTPKKRVKLLDEQADIYVLSISNLPWIITHFGNRWPFRALVVDESSMFKSGQTQRFETVRRILTKLERVVLLTATPSPNSLLELHPQVSMLDPAGIRLGRYFSHFRSRYFYPTDYMQYDWELKPGADEEIWNAISDISVSMSKADHLKMPPLTINMVRVDLPPAGIRAYKAHGKDSFVNE